MFDLSPLTDRCHSRRIENFQYEWSFGQLRTRCLSLDVAMYGMNPVAHPDRLQFENIYKVNTEGILGPYKWLSGFWSTARIKS